MHISTKNSACRKNSDETKYMFFLIKDDELLEKYNEIWISSKKTLTVNQYIMKISKSQNNREHLIENILMKKILMKKILKKKIKKKLI